jgi:hypothetical protein
MYHPSITGAWCLYTISNYSMPIIFTRLPYIEIQTYRELSVPR